jgi:hypothetical protein
MQQLGKIGYHAALEPVHLALRPLQQPLAAKATALSVLLVESLKQ